MPGIRRRRPVLRAAGAAVVGSAAYRAGKRRGFESGAEAPPPGSDYGTAPAPPSAGLSPETLQQLEQLGRLHEQGILTDEEFEQQKRRCLQS